MGQSRPAKPSPTELSRRNAAVVCGKLRSKHKVPIGLGVLHRRPAPLWGRFLRAPRKDKRPVAGGLSIVTRGPL